ncbi:MAG: amidase, partial [Quisquiliibacterium sp.]
RTPRPASLRGQRFWVPRGIPLDGLDAAVAAGFEDACRRLSDAGATLQDIQVPEFADLARINRQGGFAAAEAWWWHAALLARREADYDPRVAARIRRGELISAADYLTLLSERERWIAAVGSRLQGDL